MKSGDSNQITRDYLDSLMIEQRLIGSDLPSTETVILGKRFATPVMNAAFSHLESGHPGSPAAMAEGFKAAGGLNWWGMSTDEEMEKIYATGADTVEIIKPYADEDMIFHRIAFALEHGAFAVGMDIDHAFDGSGHYDNVAGIEMRPKSAAQLRAYVEAAKGKPFVVKGVLSVQDALACRDAGVSAIMVSHHHGIFPFAVPPLMILPDIAEAVGDDMELYVDCGMQSGMDVFKALALGAKAVSVSRHILEKVFEGGAKGTEQEVRKMTGELAAVMARTGFASVDAINSDILWTE